MTEALLRFDTGLMLAALSNPAVERPLSAPAAGGVFERLRRRDPSTWRRLFDDEMPAIYRYAYSRAGSSADAEDLAAQVFEEAWKSADHIEDRGLPPRAWLFGIARHVVGSHRRRAFQRPPMLALEAFDGADESMKQATDQIALAGAIARLPKDDAEVVTLRFLHGLSLHETALAMRVSVDAIKSRQARALRKLRSLLEPLG